MPRSGRHINMNKYKDSNQISYGAQVATISIGVILGIITAVLATLLIFFGDLIKTIL